MPRRQTKKSFGTLVRAARLREGQEDQKPVQQQQLAKLAGISPAMLHQVESGKLVPIAETARKIIDALAVLGLSEQERESLLSKALSESEAKKKKTPPDVSADKNTDRTSQEFARAMEEVLEALDKDLPSLAKKLKGRPANTVRSWKDGRLFPSAETLQREILPAFEALRATDEQLNQMRVAHSRDALRKALANLVYWNDDEQRRIADCLHGCVLKYKKENDE